MRLRKKQVTNLLLLLATVFAALFLAIVFKERSIFADSEEATSETAHYINIYDGGKRTTIRSEVGTVSEALERANVEYDEKDVIEPGLDEQIDSRDYNINIYRYRPVLVLDEGRKIYSETARMTPIEVAEAAGVELKEKDIVKVENYNDILETGMTTAYRVVRAKTIKLDYYGKKTTVRTQAKTVREFCEEQNISMNSEENWISMPLDNKLAKSNEISVYRQGKQTITVDETIAFGERLDYDYDLTWGQEKITQAGQNGQKTVTYEIDMRDGQEISRVFVSEIVTKEPVEQVKVVGRKATLPPGSHEDWMAAAGISASDYGYVNFIISHESGWRPYASNGRYFGLYQTSVGRLVSDCGDNWVNDPVCQLRSAQGYAVGRYGSWAGAYQWWTSHNWW